MCKATLGSPVCVCVCKYKRPCWSIEPGSAVAMATHVRARPAILPARPIACARFPVFTKALWERFSPLIVFASGDAGGRHPLVFVLLPPSLFPTILRPPGPKGPSPTPLNLLFPCGIATTCDVREGAGEEAVVHFRIFSYEMAYIKLKLFILFHLPMQLLARVSFWC